MIARVLFLVASIAAADVAAGGGRCLAAAPQEPPRTFRATADVVSVEVSVRRDKRSVVGLTAADFDVLDNGVQQQIDLYRKKVKLFPRPRHTLSVGDPIDLSAYHNRPVDALGRHFGTAERPGRPQPEIVPVHGDVQ